MSGDDAARPGIARAVKPIPKAWLDEIEQRMLRAEAPADFVPELAQRFGRHPRKVWNYVAKVRARLAERAKAHDPEADREMIRAMLMRAYRVAEVGTPERGADSKGMVAASKTLADVTGCTAPKRIDITTAGKQLGKMTDDELRAEREALLAELGRSSGE